MNNIKQISIIIPTYNEEKFISMCLNSVLANDYPKEKMEIFVIDGGSTDKTHSLVKQFIKKNKFIHLLPNPKKAPPSALNIGIKKAKGDYIIRLDAHSTYPNNYFSQLIHWIEKLDADNVGAVCTTKVKNINKKTTAITKVLSHKLGVGNSLFRIGTNKPTQVDTVPFGCYKKEVFNRISLYDERLIRNQDIELNKRLLKNGGKIFLVPNVFITYYARENFKDLAKNNYNNGLWNIKTIYYTKDISSISLRHFIPLFFILSIIIPMFLTCFSPKFLLLSLFSLLLYSSVVAFISIKLLNNKTNFFYLIASFFTLHFSYGFGSLVALFQVLIKMLF